MNIQLTHFEEEVEDDWLSAGKALYCSDAVTDLHELEDDLWIAKVRQGDQSPEVEILLRGKRIKNTTCDCETYLAEEICPHIVGCLFALRDKLSDSAKSQLNHGGKPKQITTKSLLNKLSREDLYQFVLTYARSDHPFALALRIRFASRIDLQDNLEKYRQILRQIKRRSLRTSSLSNRQAKRMFEWFDELAKQARDAFISGIYTEAGWCYLAMIIELNTLWNKVVAEQEKKLRQELDVLHRDLGELFHNKKVPAIFKDQLSGEIFDYLQNGNYLPPAPDLNLFVILFSYSKHQNDRILQLLTRDVHQGNQSREQISMRTSVLMYLLYHHQENLQVIPSLDIEEENLLRAADKLKGTDDDCLISWYEKLFKTIECDNRRFDIAKRMIARDNLAGHPEWAIDIGAYLIVDHNYRNALQFIKKWPDELKSELYNKIRRSREELDVRLLLHSAHALGINQNAQTLLREQIPLNQLSEFKEVMLQLDKNELIELLEHKIEEYLRDHFGQPAKRSIEKILSLLSEHGRTDETNHLIRSLNARYQKRTSFYIEQDEL